MGEQRISAKDIPDEEILTACDKFHRHEGPTPDKALAHKYPVKVIMAKMEKLSRKGMIDYGVSLRTGWRV